MMTPTILLSPPSAPVFVTAVRGAGMTDAAPVPAFFAAILSAASIRVEVPETPVGVVPVPIDPPTAVPMGVLIAKPIRPGLAQPEPLTPDTVAAIPRRTVTPEFLWAVIEGRAAPRPARIVLAVPEVETPGEPDFPVDASGAFAIPVVAVQEDKPSLPVAPQLGAAAEAAPLPNAARNIAPRIRLQPVYDAAPKLPTQMAIAMPAVAPDARKPASALSSIAWRPLDTDVGAISPPILLAAVVRRATVTRTAADVTAEIGKLAIGEAPRADPQRASREDGSTAEAVPLGDGGIPLVIGLQPADILPVVAAGPAWAASPAAIPPTVAAMPSPAGTDMAARAGQHDRHSATPVRSDALPATQVIDASARVIGIDPALSLAASPVPPATGKAERPATDAPTQPSREAAALAAAPSPALPVMADVSAAAAKPAPSFVAPDVSASAPGRNRIERTNVDRDVPVESATGVRMSGAIPISVAPAPNMTNAAPPAFQPEATPRAAEAPATMTVMSDRLGDVGIGLDGGPQDLRVQLSGSPSAAGALAAEVPRLMADLAANGLRLQSLDIGGQAGGQGLAQNSGQSPDGRPRQAPVPAAAMAFAADPSREAAVRRASLSERYA